MKKKFSTLNSQLSNRSGFTLVELIVVMAIIAILATLMMFNFIEVNKRARDGQRKSDLSSLRSALEIYRSDDTLGQYPANTASPYTINVACGSPFTQTIGSSTITYMSKMPCDPNNTAWNNGKYFYYITDSPNNMKYVFIACLENTNDKEAVAWTSIDFGGSPVSMPGGCAGTTTDKRYYVVYNP